MVTFALNSGRSHSHPSGALVSVWRQISVSVKHISQTKVQISFTWVKHTVPCVYFPGLSHRKENSWGLVLIFFL